MIQVGVISVLINVFQNVQGFNKYDPVVVTKLGSIRGVRAEDGNYTKFMGIPYGKVNDSNVFGDSLPYPPFQDIFEADNDRVLCPQVENFNYTLAGSKECLNLNIHVPDSASSSNPLPVLVYIFGGRFKIGRPDRYMFGSQYLIRHDVIFVAINYRLGPYGFMCLNIPEVPGNQGFKDQRRAIRWIKSNIKAFGGDSNRITLFGNSAGGMSIGLLLISHSERLCNNAILHSGNSVYSGLIRDNDPSMPQKIASQLGLFTNNTYTALSFLNNINEHRVIEAAVKAGFEHMACIEKKFDGVEPFLTENPINMKENNVSGIDIMIGYVKNEGMYYFADDNATNNPFVFSNRLISNFNFDEELLAELEPIVRRFYIGDEEINVGVKQELIDFTSDTWLFYSTKRAIARFVEGKAKKVYQFVFGYDGTRNYFKIKNNINYPGVAHGDDLGYLFKMEYSAVPEPSVEDQLIIDRITTMWTNFAKYGDPTPNTTQLLPVKWRPITEESPQYYLLIDTDMEEGKYHLQHRMSFWELFYKAYAKYEIGYKNIEEYEVANSSSKITKIN